MTVALAAAKLSAFMCDNDDLTCDLSGFVVLCHGRLGEDAVSASVPPRMHSAFSRTNLLQASLGIQL